MLNQYSRTELLFGKDAMERLRRSRVAVFGIGGVGGYTVEALVRSGVGKVLPRTNHRIQNKDGCTNVKQMVLQKDNINNGYSRKFRT